jgi:hypothetical protein
MLSSVLSRHLPRRIVVLGLSCLFSAAASAGEPLYQNDFEKAEVGNAPPDFTITAGAFAVQGEGSNKFLELPGSPLDTFGLLFGPSIQGDAAASGRFFGTKVGRKFPTFGLSLNGVSGYRLQVSPAKKALEIYKGDEPKASVPLDWQSGSWTHLRLQVRKDGNGWIAEGKAWADGAPEPADWTIKFADPETASAGRAGLWGSPFSGTPIRYDDLRVEKVP